MSKAVLFAIFSNALFAQSDATQSPPKVIKEIVSNAKNKGLTTVTIPAPIALRTGIDSIEAVEGHYSVIIGEPTRSSVVVDGNQLTTWYAVRVREVVLHQPRLHPPTFNPPPSMPPAAADEVFLAIAGGEAQIDGVTVKQHGLELQVGRDYVLVVNIRVGRIAELAAQETGVFEIDPTRTLIPARAMSSLAREIHNRWANDLDTVKAFLKDRDRAIQ